MTNVVTAQVAIDTTNNETVDRNLHHIQTNFNTLFAGTKQISTGTFTLNSGTPVVVPDATVTALSQISWTLVTPGGTPAAPFLVTITPGTGFHVNGGGSDTSTYNYKIIG